MKKLVFKTMFFVAPLFILYFIFNQCYSTNKGDLLRLGYIADISDFNPKEVFKSELNRSVKFSLFSNLNLKDKNSFTVFTIGDSFSEQGNVSYQNYLADNSEIKVLHFDKFLHKNQINTLHGLLNGGLFNNIKVDYVILESIERDFVKQAINLETNVKIFDDSLSELIKKQKHKLLKNKNEKQKDNFFSRETLSFYLNAINYNFDDNAYSSKTYLIKSNKQLFSNVENHIMILDEDLISLEINNNIKNIEKLNFELNFLANKLKNKGIKLIVLPCPDKFDYYYDNFMNKENYTKPIFF